MAALTIEQALQLALAHHQSGQLALAETLCRQILAVQSGQVVALHMLGLIAIATERFTEGVEWLKKTVALYPDRASAHSDLGVAYRNLGMYAEAVSCYQRAITLTPTVAYLRANLGESLQNLGKFAEAKECYLQAMAVDPNCPEVHNNLGNLYVEQGLWEQAEESFRKALALEPKNAMHHANLGVVCLKAGRYMEATGACRRSLDLAPGFPKARATLATIFLLQGRYEEGWREFECRGAGLSTPERRVSGARWTGERIDGQVIIIHPEQGIGDCIQFLRYVPLVGRHSGAARVILVLPPTLRRLLGNADGWNAEIHYSDVWDEANLPRYDWQIPMLSLPFALRLFEPNHPALVPVPYLSADGGLRKCWSERLGSKAGLSVGLVWSGNHLHKDDARRSIQAIEMLPILKVPHIRFYSLQIEANAGHLQQLVENGLMDLTAHIADFADTAAFMAEMDLVITVDTSTAHLAGAMGKPVWTLLPFVPDSRWLLDREDSPWYPSMRLFRQKEAGEWASVVRRVVEELNA